MIRRRSMLSWAAVVALTIVWLLLWGTLSPLVVLGGVIASYLVMLIFPLPSIGYKGTLHIGYAFVFVVRFLWDLVRASIHIAWIAIRPAPPPTSAIIRARLNSESDLILTLTAAVTILIPGSIVIEASQEDHVLYLHIFDVHDQDDLARARQRVLEQEARIVRAIGSAEERERLSP